MTISMKQRKHNQYAWYASAGASHNYLDTITNEYKQINKKKGKLEGYINS